MEKKKQFKWFTIFEYEKEEEYLREMHRSGWRFVKVRGLGVYHFESCEPEDVVYALDYNKEGLANKEEYIKIFDDCGWEYIQDYAGYSYFRKPVKERGREEAIFCDQESRTQMMERVMKGRMLPLLVLFVLVLLPQFLLNLLVFHEYIIAAVFGLILALYIYVFVVCAVKYNNYKK